MSDPDQDAPRVARSDASRIPVRNWWHMLLYAWDMAQFTDRYEAVLDDAPEPRALLTRLLAYLMERQVRRGLRGDYVDRSEALRTVRGRIDFATTFRRQLLNDARLQCEYQELDLDVPKNQIVASTLRREESRGTLHELGGSDRDHTAARRLRLLLQMLVEIDRVRVTRSLIASEMRKLGSNDREYALMLRICQMLVDPAMPDATDGVPRGFVSWERVRDHQLYERFVAGFYRLRLGSDWHVAPQTVLRWNELSRSHDHGRLPQMRPDIVLRNRARSVRVVIDTKWYSGGALTRDREGDLDAVRTKNLYQMFSYLASQDHLGSDYRDATGILLYAQPVEEPVRFRTQIDDHPFWVQTIDLSQPWQTIESDLLTLISDAEGLYRDATTRP